MRITKRMVNFEKRQLSKETGMGLYLEEYFYGKKNQFTLLQLDENGEVVKTLIEDYLTTKEMYLALKAAREICKALTNISKV